MKKKNKRHNKTVLLARSKLNSIENRISETLIDNEISNEDFTLNTNEVGNYLN